MLAHNVSSADANFLSSQSGLLFWAYGYLGAKHMVTGVDHLLFLAGVIFYLRQFRDVLTYVTLFAAGHSITLLLGVLLQINANAFLVDAVIGFSVVYKAFENLGGLRHLRYSLDAKRAVLLFGFCHGLGLATKLQQLQLAQEGLLGNLLAFNIGIELGQLFALSGLVLLIFSWRRFPRFDQHAIVINVLLMSAGLVLMATQVTGYCISTNSCLTS